MKIEYHKTEQENTGIYTIYDDHTIGNLLVNEIINYDGINHISYIEPHPLEKKIEIMIITKEDHDMILLRAIESIKNKLNLIKTVFNEES